MLELGERKVSVDGLGDLVGGFEVESYLCDYTEAAEMNDSPEEGVSVMGAGEGVEGSVGGDELDGGNGGREVLVVDAGAVSCGCGGSGDGDVGKRGEVMESEALGIDDRSEVAVANARADGDRAGFFVDADLVEFVEGYLGLGTVGDGVEGVPGAKGPELGMVLDELLEFGDGGGLEEIGSVVGEVSGPVGAGFGCGLLGGGEAGEKASSHKGS